MDVDKPRFSSPIIGVLLFLAICAISTFPFIVLDIPIWLTFLLVLLQNTLPIVGGIVAIILWAWSFIVVIQKEFTWFSALFYLAFAIGAFRILMPWFAKKKDNPFDA